MPMVRSFFASALLLSLAAAACAQSSASSHATLNYSFALDGASQPFASDVVIEDQGLQTYNLIVPFDPSNGADNSLYFAPYTASTGNGNAYAEVNGGTYFDLSSQTGFAGVDSYAERNPDGTADASVGTQETMVIYNNGANDVTFDILAFAEAQGLATATSGTSQVDTYVGIVSYDFTAQTFYNPLIHIYGPNGAVVTSTTAEWTAQGNDTYQASFGFTVKAGQSRSLGFYTSSINHAAPVPEPASLAALGLGAAAVLRRRKRAKRVLVRRALLSGVQGNAYRSMRLYFISEFSFMPRKKTKTRLPFSLRTANL